MAKLSNLNQVGAWLTAAVAAGLSVAPNGAFAQTSATDPNGSVLEEVTVTAQKRVENLQQVGIAISAFTDEELKNRGISTMAGLAEIAPNVVLHEDLGGGVPVVIVRGIGVQDIRINSTAASSVYLDDVYQSTLVAASFPFFDNQSVEILKGPQGGLYGRNAMAGAVSVTSNPPKLGEYSAKLSAGYGSWDTFRADGFINAPLGDSAALRIAAATSDGSGGPWRSTTYDFRSGVPKQSAARAIFAWVPTEAWDIRLQIFGGVDKSTLALPRPVGIWSPTATPILSMPATANGVANNYGLLAPSPSSVCGAILAGYRDDQNCQTVSGQTLPQLGIGPHDYYSSGNSTRNNLDNKWRGALVNPRYSVGNYTLQSITAFNALDYRHNTDWDGVPVSSAVLFYNTEARAWSQEFRLSYDDKRLNYIAGATYAHEILKDHDVELSPGGIVLFYYGPVLSEKFSQPTDAYALYDHTEYRVTDRWKLIAELRYSIEHKENHESIDVLTALPWENPQELYPLFSPVSWTLNSKLFTGKMSVNYAPEDNVLVYGSISRGAKSGGFWGGMTTTPQATMAYKPETNLAYEVGAKSDLFNHTLRLNLAGYYYRINDYQAPALFQAVGAQIDAVTNVGRVRDYGVEANAEWVPDNHWTVTGAIATADAKISHSPLATPDAFSTGLVHPLQGTNVPNYSKITGQIAVHYRFNTFAGLMAQIGGDYEYRTSQDLQRIVYAPEAAVFHEPGYGTLNLQMSLATPDKGWQISAFANNVTNTRYRTTADIDGVGALFEIYGLPVSWGVRLQKSF